MPLTPVLFLFLCHMGIGIVFTMLLISSAAGVRFFRFASATAFILVALGIAFHPAALRFSRDAQGIASASLLGGLLSLSLVVARTNPWRRAFLWVSAAAGLVTLGAQSVSAPSAVSAPSSVPLLLTMGSFVTSTVLLGSSFTAMLLGHWYLVLPSMDVALLQRVVKFHLGSTVARVLSVFAVACAAAVGWDSLLAPSFLAYAFSIDGIFLWQRLFFGLIGPVVLAYMTWETAKLRSTQSATGILYVDLFMVMVGELVAKYILLSAALPF
jgi:protein NrfD